MGSHARENIQFNLILVNLRDTGVSDMNKRISLLFIFVAGIIMYIVG